MGPVVAAYLLADVAQQIAFTLVAAMAFAALFVSGSLTPSDLLAGSAFVIYLLVMLIVLSAALRSRNRFEPCIARSTGSVAAAPSNPTTPRQTNSMPASRCSRANQRRWLVILAPALAADLLLVGVFFCCLQAVGASASLRLALIAFGVSTLFGIIGFLPSGIGSVEVSAYAVLASGGVAPVHAATAVALYRMAELWIPVIIGIVASGGRLRREHRTWVRACAAVLSAVTGAIAMLAAADSGTARRIRPGGLVRGASGRTISCSHSAASPCARRALTLWRGKRSAAVVAPLNQLMARPEHGCPPRRARRRRHRSRDLDRTRA